MGAKAVLKRLWHDPVWSKVIAAAILGSEALSNINTDDCTWKALGTSVQMKCPSVTFSLPSGEESSRRINDVLVLTIDGSSMNGTMGEPDNHRQDSSVQLKLKKSE
jgi:hypothetical protein